MSRSRPDEEEEESTSSRGYSMCKGPEVEKVPGMWQELKASQCG